MGVDFAAISSQVDVLPLDQQKEILDLLEELGHARDREAAQSDFLAFVRHVWPAFIEGDHHRVMADAFNRIANGELKRLIINMPPRICFLPGIWADIPTGR